MPTSQQEAVRIQEIINDYLNEGEAREISIRLDEEIGQHTSNDSLRISLSMLRKLYDA